MPAAPGTLAPGYERHHRESGYRGVLRVKTTDGAWRPLWRCEHAHRGHGDARMCAIDEQFRRRHPQQEA